MTKNQIIQYTPEINEAFKPEVLQVIKNSLAPNSNDQEFLLFAHKAASYGLDPFKNEIFFIKYGNTARIQFAAEAYLSKAREQEGFQPPDTQMVHENDEFKVAMNKETKELEVVLHEIGFPRGQIIGAYSISYRAGYRPVTVISDIEEIQHVFTGQNKDNWKKWTSDMYGKHVQQRALKKQYGLDFGDETINQGEQENDIPEYKQQERKDITPNQEVIENGSHEEADLETNESNDIRQKINSLFKKIGIKTKDQKAKFIEEYAPNMGEKPSLAEMKGFIKILELQIEMNESNTIDSDELE